MKRRVNVGEDFEGRVKLIDAIVQKQRETTRSYIALAIVAFAMAFLVGAAILGMVQGNFGGLSAVWAAAAAPLGGALTYYFNGHAKR